MKTRKRESLQKLGPRELVWGKKTREEKSKVKKEGSGKKIAASAVSARQVRKESNTVKWFRSECACVLRDCVQLGVRQNCVCVSRPLQPPATATSNNPPKKVNHRRRRKREKQTSIMSEAGNNHRRRSGHAAGTAGYQAVEGQTRSQVHQESATAGQCHTCP